MDSHDVFQLLERITTQNERLLNRVAALEQSYKNTTIWIDDLPLDVAQTAQVCGTSTQTIRNWMVEGLEKISEHGRAYTTLGKLRKFLRGDPKYADAATPARVMRLLKPRISA